MIIYITNPPRFKWFLPDTIGKIFNRSTIAHCTITIITKEQTTMMRTIRMELGLEQRTNRWILRHDLFQLVETIEIIML